MCHSGLGRLTEVNMLVLKLACIEACKDLITDLTQSETH